jgi:hypothetical protein
MVEITREPEFVYAASCRVKSSLACMPMCEFFLSNQRGISISIKKTNQNLYIIGAHTPTPRLRNSRAREFDTQFTGTDNL